ncbi:hypothetical protein [Mesorhizobium sp. B2-6-4]|uniref:hypothetical protein n=1 Tax=Mesorhizobium sp. B2-6-4 TaxID=2589913 RepID=UPI001129063E|nr:hypothetical protein [Mesorhizobium sp. B2-6-4]TPJ54717.1 hypothetical protein FJ426_06900 [Mesorhizobium sp. B2-6-4]
MTAMENEKRYFCRLTEDEKLFVLDGLERSGSVRMMANVLKGNFSDLATSASEDVRAKYARWQEVTKKWLAIEAEWGEGALLKLDDPVFVDLRSKGQLNPDIIRNAEAYAAAHSSLPEFSSPSVS